MTARRRAALAFFFARLAWTGFVAYMIFREAGLWTAVGYATCAAGFEFVVTALGPAHEVQKQLRRLVDSVEAIRHLESERAGALRGLRGLRKR